MRTSRPLFLLLACLVVPVSLPAQGSSSSSTTSVAPGTSDPQAVALVQRALAALTGGVAVADVTLNGTARSIAGSDDESGTATLTALAAGDSKVSLNLTSGPRSEIRNPASTSSSGVAVGTWSGPDGTLHPMAEHNLMTDPTWFFPAFTLANLMSSQNYELNYVGLETHDSQAVVHISASQQFPAPANTPSQIAVLPQHLSQMDLYVDPTSLLPVALAFNTHPDTNALVDIAIEIRFSGYQTVSGVEVPLHVQQYINNGLSLDLQFSSTILNSGLSISAFALN